MSNIKIYENIEFGKIRVEEKGEDPWFVANDICKILGYSNPRKAIIDHVDPEDKVVTKCDTLGGQQEVTIINESGLYSLILSSKLPKAKTFKRWITNEVIPSIRKHGVYLTPDKLEEVLLNPDTLIKLATELKEEKLINARKEQLIGELKPKADYTDLILKNKGIVTVTAIAKDYGMSAEKMNEKLHQLGIQYKQSDQWFLYSKYHNMGYTHSETIPITRRDGRHDIKMNTKWTQKGRLFLYNILKENGIVPVIEREV